MRAHEGVLTYEPRRRAQTTRKTGAQTPGRNVKAVRTRGKLNEARVGPHAPALAARLADAKARSNSKSDADRQGYREDRAPRDAARQLTRRRVFPFFSIAYLFAPYVLRLSANATG